MRCQTYGYLPRRKASPPIGWYQIILLGDRGTCVLTTCPGLHSIAERPGFELATNRSQVQRPNHSATEPHIQPGVKVHTLDIAPLRSESPPQKCSGVGRIEWFTSKRHCYKASCPTFPCLLKNYAVLCP